MSKILIVEDNLSIQALLHDFIQEAGDEMQNYLNGLSEEEIAGSDIKKMLKTKSAELAASLSTENMKLSPCDIYMIDICHNGTAITAALSSQRTGQFPFSRILRRGIWTDSPQALRR